MKTAYRVIRAWDNREIGTYLAEDQFSAIAMASESIGEDLDLEACIVLIDDVVDDED